MTHNGSPDDTRDIEDHDVSTPELRHALILRYVGDAAEHHDNLLDMLGCGATAFLDSLLYGMVSKMLGTDVRHIPLSYRMLVECLVNGGGFDVHCLQILGRVADLVDAEGAGRALPADVEALRPKRSEG